MIHNSLTLYPEQAGAHWAVGINSERPAVLAQFQDEHGTQVRVRMTPMEARGMAQELEYWAYEVAAEAGRECPTAHNPCP